VENFEVVGQTWVRVDISADKQKEENEKTKRVESIEGSGRSK